MSSDSRGPLARLVSLLFGLSAPVGPVRYAVAGVSLMLLKYLLDAGAVYAVTGGFFTPQEYVQPLYFVRYGSLMEHKGLVAAMLVWSLPFLWIGISMSVRRALDAGLSPWVALLFFIPGVNYLFMLAMCVLPSKPALREAPTARQPGPGMRSALLGAAGGGVLVGLGMTALSVYALKSYGAALFFGTPFLMGALSAHLFNRKYPRPLRTTLGVSASTVGMTGLALLLFALEGVLCIAMALPLALGTALLGGFMGWMLTQRTPSSGVAVLLAVLALPLLAWSDRGGPLPLHEVMTATEIDAPPERVFPHVVGFSDLPPASRWWFQNGVAHPRRARIEGQGVGAVRYCEFSTGPFVEPITAWEAPHRLAFDVTSQPPPLEEWSPYGAIDAPHLDHYLRSRRGEFRLVPLPGGRTRLEGRTWYELDIHPQVYWRPWAQALIHSIHGEVLGHIRSLAEGPEVAARP